MGEGTPTSITPNTLNTYIHSLLSFFPLSFSLLYFILSFFLLSSFILPSFFLHSSSLFLFFTTPTNPTQKREKTKKSQILKRAEIGVDSSVRARKKRREVARGRRFFSEGSRGLNPSELNEKNRKRENSPKKGGVRKWAKSPN